MVGMVVSRPSDSISLVFPLHPGAFFLHETRKYGMGYDACDMMSSVGQKTACTGS